MDPVMMLFLGVAALAIIVLVIVVIYLVADLHKTTRSVRQFLEDENHSLQLTLREVNLTLEHLRHITDGVTTIVNDVRVASGPVRAMGEGLMKVTDRVKHLSDNLETTGSSVRANMTGIKAGAQAALSVVRSGFWKHRKTCA
jgi:uncharacterized protein YoxC